MSPDQAAKIDGTIVRILPVPWIYEKKILLSLEALNQWQIRIIGDIAEVTNVFRKHRIRLPLQTLRGQSDQATLNLTGQVIVRASGKSRKSSRIAPISLKIPP